jgi:hypothetical protein
MKKAPKIIELKIDDGLLENGVDAIAFVEEPAIEIDFMAFSKEEFETYNDYPKKAVENAKRGIELNKENKQKCATQVGKVRAQQLANGENLSLDTIRRMRAFLIRQKGNYDKAIAKKDYNACGYISYLLWGGEEALPWAEKKLRQAGEEFEGLEDACQAGYKAIGLKTKNGRKVPNCVPIENLSKVEEVILEGIMFEKLLEGKVDEMARVGLTPAPDRMPYYNTPEEARKQSPKYGCSIDSWHKYVRGGKTYYMPCGSHDQLFAKEESWVEELTDELETIVESALNNVGKTEKELIDEGYDFENAIAIDDKETFVASVGKIKSVQDLNDPSTDDFGDWAVFYRYMRYDDTPTFGSNSREFCKNVIRAGKYFRKEDINKLTISGANEGFGLNGQTFYDIFTYKGGKNCQHYWQKFAVPKKRENKRDIKRPSAILDRVNDATTLNAGTLSTLLADGRLGFSAEDMDEKQIVATPIMVPNKLIPRRDENGEKYYVYFTEETIKKIAYAFAQAKNADRINHEHDMDSMVDDVYVAESWIIDEPNNDKSNVYGYNLDKGTWFGLFKVDNDEYWRDFIKTGKVKGVSVEGYFINKLTKLI